MKRSYNAFLLALAAFLTFSGYSFATMITYQTTDLADTTPGQDLWQYSYSLTGYAFDMGYGFTIFFDYSLFSNLEDPPPSVNADWSPLVLQPDTALQSNGSYDAMALSDNASLVNSFRVNFVWLGNGTPGAQPFDIYDPNYQTVESGRTNLGGISPIPEPATVLLLTLGLVGLIGIRNNEY